MSAVEKVSSALAFTLDEFQHAVLRKGTLRSAFMQFMWHSFPVALQDWLKLMGHSTHGLTSEYLIGYMHVLIYLG
jgi:hypothetical protein